MPKETTHTTSDDGEFGFPTPLALHDKHFPDERFGLCVRYRENEEGHDNDNGNFIGGIPAGRSYMEISLDHDGGWNSDTWDRLQEAYENEGYSTHLRKSSGVTRTRSGTCHHAPTSMYVW